MLQSLQPTTSPQLKGMATALSLDSSGTAPSSCHFPPHDNLAVNFVSLHPSSTTASASASSEGSSGDSTTDASTPTPPPPPPPSPPSAAAAAAPANNLAQAARMQEIFCDYMAMTCTQQVASSRHILDERFDSFLNPGQGEWKQAMLRLMEAQPPDNKQQPQEPLLTAAARATTAHQQLQSFLQRQMGYQALTAAREVLVFEPREYQRRQFYQFFRQRPKRKEEFLDNRLDTNCWTHICCQRFRLWLELRRFSVPSGYWKQRLFARDYFWSVETGRPRGIAQLHKLLSSHVEHGDRYVVQRHENHDRVATLRDWPWRQFDEGNLTRAPLLVAGEVAVEKSGGFQASSQAQIQALLQTVQDFVAVALNLLRRHQPVPHARRQRYLLAIPVLGTGSGMAGDVTGHVVEQILFFCNQYATAQDSAVDFVLVCADEATHSFAQSLRWDIYHAQTTAVATVTTSQQDLSFFPCFNLLSTHKRDTAQQLADLAANGHLSLFLGAGVSMGAGLPGWFGLLEAIEDQFTDGGLPEDRRLGDDSNWDPLVMADRLEELADVQSDRHYLVVSFKRRISELIEEKSHHPGLLLALLTALSCRAIVTQNYDQLIEKAYRRRNLAESNRSEVVSVIPHAPVRGADLWLLKMHGCVSRPEQIIITSKDYQEYDTSRMKALAGLVQANLMTSHLLFVGFSLTDPNYLRIIHEVRQALDPGVAGG